MAMDLRWLNKCKIATMIILLCAFQIFYFDLLKSNAETKELTATEKEDDAKIKAIWAEFRSAVKSKDIKKALEYIEENVRSTYEYNFNLLKDRLDEVASSLRDIELDEFKYGYMADYRMLIEFEGEKNDCLVRFEKDQNGNWKIRFF
jgi:hypothetical protein